MHQLAFSIRDACAVSALSRSELYRRLAAGNIVGIKSGRRTLICAESLRRHMASLPRATFRQPAKVAA